VAKPEENIGVTFEE
jgi:hypothetical protein